jgi:hypothetical protein
MEGKKWKGKKDFLGDGESEPLMNTHETLIEIISAESQNNGMHRSVPRPPRGSPAWCRDRNQNAGTRATPPPRGLSTWGDVPIGRATIDCPSSVTTTDGEVRGTTGALRNPGCLVQLEAKLA